MPQATKAPPPRLHVLLRKKTAVVILRGRNKSVATFAWNLEDDSFALGQWFRGRIYEYRCDLSPDGKYLIYFAAKYWRRDAVSQRVEAALKEKFKTEDLWYTPYSLREKAEDEIRATRHKEFEKLQNSLDFNAPSWTAISRAPYLKAIDLWWNGSGWNGGGAFLSERKVWLNHPSFMFRPPVLTSGKFSVTHNPIPELGYENVHSECPLNYFPKLKRDGWASKGDSGDKLHYDVLFEKRLPDSRILQKRFLSGFSNVPGRSVYWEQHNIVDDTGRQILDGEAWQWADYDAPRERILFAQGGCLWALPATKPESEPSLLKDFREMEFENIVAPY